MTKGRTSQNSPYGNVNQSSVITGWNVENVCMNATKAIDVLLLSEDEPEEEDEYESDYVPSVSRDAISKVRLLLKNEKGKNIDNRECRFLFLSQIEPPSLVKFDTI